MALRRATGDIAEIAHIVKAMGSRSVIVQPLLARGEPIGAMFFVVGPERRYTAAEVEVTSELAHRVALAISNAQVHAAEQEARRAAEAAATRLERLQRVTRELGAEIDARRRRRPRRPGGPGGVRGKRRGRRAPGRARPVRRRHRGL